MSNQCLFCKMPEKTPWSKPKNRNAARQHVEMATRRGRPCRYQFLMGSSLFDNAGETNKPSRL